MNPFNADHTYSKGITPGKRLFVGGESNSMPNRDPQLPHLEQFFIAEVQPGKGITKFKQVDVTRKQMKNEDRYNIITTEYLHKERCKD